MNLNLPNSYLLRPILLLCLLWHTGQLSAQIPANYQLVYEQDFEEAAALDDFEMSDPSAWKRTEENGQYCLELVGGSDYQPRVRSPRNIAILKPHTFGSFVLEADLLQTGREYGHRDLCLFFSMKDPANFYYLHIASKADPHAHNIFLVNDEPRRAIAEKTTEGIQWGQNQWHKIRLVREVESGLIQLYFDDMETPIMETHDQHFDYGYVGFGSFDDSGKFDNIKIWAPPAQGPAKGFFK